MNSKNKVFSIQIYFSPFFLVSKDLYVHKKMKNHDMQVSKSLYALKTYGVMMHLKRLKMKLGKQQQPD